MTVAWFTFDETSGNYKNNIGPSILIPTNSSCYKNNGKIAGCFNSTGHIGYATCNDVKIAKAIKSSIYSISFWWHPQFVTLSNPSCELFALADDLNSAKKWGICHGMDASGIPSPILDTNWFASLNVQSINASSQPVTINFNNCTPAKKWYHIAITCDGISFKYYVDGVLINTINNIIDHFKIAGNEILRVAKDVHSDLIDDLRISDNVLSLKEVQDLARGLYLHYDFTCATQKGTNLLSTSSFIGWSDYGYGNDGTFVENGNEVLRIYNKASECGKRIPITLPSTGKYCFSVYVRPISRAGLIVPGFKVTGVANQTVSATWTKVGSFQRISAEINCTATSGYFVLTPIGTGEITCEYSMPQIEPNELSDFNYSSQIGEVYDASGNTSGLNYVGTPILKENEFGKYSRFFNNISPIHYFTSKEQVYIPEDFSIIYKVKASRLLQNATASGIVNWQNNFRVRGGTAVNDRVELYFKTSSTLWTTAPTLTDHFNNQWNTIAITKNGTTYKIYRNGILVDTKILANIYGRTTYDFFSIGSDQNGGLNGDIEFVKVFTTALSDKAVFEISQSRAEIDKNNIFFSKQYEEKGIYKPSLLDYSTWIEGTTGSQVGFVQNGASSENFIIKQKNPYGQEDLLWACMNNNSGSDDDGGWNTTPFSVDSTKLYRFSCWYYMDDNPNGRAYFGCGGNTVKNIGDGSVNNNPYFHHMVSDASIANKWCLWVGYVFPHNATITYNGGVYNTDGVIITEISSFKWVEGITASMARSYLFYSTDPKKKLYLYRPRVDLIDGTEPTHEQLINLMENPNILDTSSSYGIGIKTKFNTFSDIGPANNLSVYYSSKNFVGFWQDTSTNKLDTVVTNNAITTKGVLVETPIMLQEISKRLLTDKISIFGIVSCDNLQQNLTGIGRYFISNMAAGGGYEISLETSGLYFRIFANGSSRNIFIQKVLINPDINAATTFSFAFTFDGRYLKGYLNGIHIPDAYLDLGSVQKITYASNPGKLIIGGKSTSTGPDPNTNYRWSDYIETIRIYNEALTPTEVKVLSSIGNISIINKGILYTKKMIEE